MTSNLRSKNLLIALFFCFPILVIAQKKIYTQSEIDTLQIRPLNKENLVSFKKIFLKNDLNGWTKYYASYAYHMTFIGENDSAIYYAEKAITAYSNLKEKRPEDEIHLVNAYFAMGKSFQAKKDYQKSTSSLLKSLDVEKKYPVKGRAYIIANIAHNHLSLGNDSLALNYYKRALKDSMYSSNERSLATALMRIGILYGANSSKNLDSSKFYLHKAVKTSLNSNYKNNLPSMYSNLGSIHKEESNRDSAIFYFSKANEALKVHEPLTEEGSRKIPLHNISNYSYVKIHMGKLDEAIHDLNGVLDSLSAFNEYNKNDRDIFISTYDNLILAYLNKGDRNKMNLTLKQKDDFIKQFHEVQLKQELEKLQVQYETKEKESEILRLEIVNDNQVILQKRQQAIFFGLIGLLLVILSGVWFYFYQRNLNNKYKRVVLQQQLLRTQMDPHFTFNALNSIVVLNKERPKEVENYVLSLSKLVRLILENSREEFVSMKKEVEALENYLLLQSNFSKKFTFKINITEEIEPEYYEIPPMMVQPFVENSIIHGIASKKQNGHIEISFTSKDDKMIQCTIQDNGIGYYMTKQTNSHTSRKHTSLSEQIINERLAIYSRKFKTDTSIDIQELKNKKNEPIGTNVKVLLPLNII